MQLARKSSFMFAAAITSAALVSIVAPFNASAHVLPGSVLEKSKGFINAMRRVDANGNLGMSCCHQEDGQGGLEEAPIKDAAGKITGYKVKIVNDELGRPLDHPVWRNIPPEAVLRYKDAVEFCRNLRETNPLSPDAETCVMPKTNALWTSTIPHKPMDNPDATDFTIYCYLPKPPKF